VWHPQRPFCKHFAVGSQDIAPFDVGCCLPEEKVQEEFQTRKGYLDLLLSTHNLKKPGQSLTLTPLKIGSKRSRLALVFDTNLDKTMNDASETSHHLLEYCTSCRISSFVFAKDQDASPPCHVWMDMGHFAPALLDHFFFFASLTSATSRQSCSVPLIVLDIVGVGGPQCLMF
jgi:hypothetical protein